MAFLRICVRLIVLVSAIVDFSAAEEQHFDWDYGEMNGPSTWSETYETCGSTKRQSPIELNTPSQSDGQLPEKENFDAELMSPTLINEGRTVVLSSKSDTLPCISGGPFESDTKYVFDQLHFHWGNDSSDGSEHSLNGKKYPLEMHIVFHNEKYDDIQAAKGYPDGIAVIGVFFKVASDPSTSIEPITSKLEDIQAFEAETEVEPFTLDSLMPFSSQLLTYPGSLTTPSCSEAVTWLVNPGPNPISESQLENFRKLQDEDGDPLVDNFRPVQPIGDRKVKLLSNE